MFWGINSCPYFPLELQKSWLSQPRQIAQAINWVIPMYSFKMMPAITARAHKWMLHKMRWRPPLGRSHKIYSISKLFLGLGKQVLSSQILRVGETCILSDLSIIQADRAGWRAPWLTTTTASGRAGWMGLLAQYAFLAISLPTLFSGSENWNCSALSCSHKETHASWLYYFYSGESWVLHINLDSCVT